MLVVTSVVRVILYTLVDYNYIHLDQNEQTSVLGSFFFWHNDRHS